MTAPDSSLSPTTGKAPLHGKSLIKRLVFVGVEDDRETLGLISKIKEKWPDIKYTHSKTGVECLDDHDVVFFFKDFTGELFSRISAEIYERDRPRARIVGLPYIKNRLLLDQFLYSPRPFRPLFSDQMASVMVTLTSELNREKKTYARYIQYMGGKIKKDFQGSVRALPKGSTLVFVGKGLNKEQRIAAFMQINTLTPEWVEYCWSQRFDLKLNVLDHNLLATYSIRVFEGLKIFFVGFSAVDIADMTKNVVNNGGGIVHLITDATHIVCDPTYNDLKSLVISEKQMAVTDHWLWQSINSNRCLNEDSYFLKDCPTLCRMATTYERVKSTASLADCERSKGSDDFSSDDLETCLSPISRTPKTTSATPLSTKGYDKRQQVVLELLETERNYVNALNLAHKFRLMIENEWIKKEGETLITRSDLQLIFGKLPAIINVHNTILQKIQAYVDNWDKLNQTGTPLSSKRNSETNYDIADIWMIEKARLTAAYPPYINSFENSKSVFESADQKNSRFHAFSKESDPEFNRNKLADLLIRPVQRLPSVTLLLKELQKKTTKPSQINKLSDAVTALQTVLTHANTIRYKTDSKIAHLTRFTDMDKVPDHLVCSRRTFIAEMDAVSVIGQGDFQKWPKVDVRILLFNDVIVVCKTRNQTSHSPPGLSRTPTGTMSRLKKQTSLATIRRGHKKPLKYIKHIPIQYIRDIKELRDLQEMENTNLLYYPPHPGGPPGGPAPIMVVIIREDTYADIVWVIHPVDRLAMEEVFNPLKEHIMMEFGRTIRNSVPCPLSDLLQLPEIEDTLRKYLKRIQQNQPNATFNMTMSRGGSMLRRAISSASMSVANRLSRMTTSRSNLREIMETPSNEKVEVMRGAPNTPSYDVHPRIDTYSSPDLLETTQFTTPNTKRSLRSRLSTLNITQTLFRRPSIRQRTITSSLIEEENKEN